MRKDKAEGLNNINQSLISHFPFLIKKHYLCTRLEKAGALSSAGLEHLPYKQRVGGSNPSAPTPEGVPMVFGTLFSRYGFVTCKPKPFLITLCEKR